MQNLLFALWENVESDPIIRDPERVLTCTGVNHRIEHLGTHQVRYQLEQPTTVMTKWDVVVSWLPILFVQRQKIRGKNVVSKEDYSCIENKDENRTELVVQSNMYRLEAMFLGGKANSKLSCDMDSVDMRAAENQGKRTDHAYDLGVPHYLLNLQSEWSPERSSDQGNVFSKRWMFLLLLLTLALQLFAALCRDFCVVDCFDPQEHERRISAITQYTCFVAESLGPARHLYFLASSTWMDGV